MADATAPEGTEPLWLPSGWLVVVLLLTSAAPVFGERIAPPAGSDGWRPRSSASNSTVTHRAIASPLTRSPSQAVIAPRPAEPRWDRSLRPVDYQDDIAGPALRVAQRERPDTDALRRRPTRFAQQDNLEELIERPLGTDPNAARQYEELPADPFDQPPFGANEREPARPAENNDYVRSPAEEEPPKNRGRDIAEDLAAPFGTSDTIDRGNDTALEEDLAEARKDCVEELAKVKAKRLIGLDLSIGVAGVAGEDYPYECSIDDGMVGAPRCWAEITYMWKASALCHKPLYFEDVHLERYGHSWGPVLQPLVSGAHFFGRLPVLPYCIGLKTPNECVYTLGHYRPGSCAPYTIDPIPFTWRAALFQAGGAVGVASFLP
ncbi:hypothetical protein [Botrimarina hoheduenensis]|uniref:Uncharacterized protein n=1 Tax=Botrimarina hoheduenensis TaxID=2528000 RepID=A0A5C5W0W3_9BACT|nr:hypothetical protein [Botrimarina hoheduenensis]TWT43412.1 hypothetical protein Pla111_23630 [Botrimarina hoheduenensis]